TSGVQRYSPSSRSKASSSAVVPSSRAASSYAARAWPISFWAIEENATSSSSVGAIPVHSESRQPTTSSSSASSSRSRSRSLTCLFGPHLERLAVDAPVLQIELAGKVVALVPRVARDEPQRLGLAPAPELLARPRLREGGVGRVDRAGVLERLALLLLAKDLEDHAAIASRTHRSCSRKRRRSSSRSAERGPCPVTTALSSSQSGSVYSQTPWSERRSFASGTVRPSSQICGP